MENLFESFSGVSKSKWLEKVELDLKGKPLEELDWMFDGGQHSPFFHHEDLSNDIGIVPSNRSNNTWLIGESIPLSDFKKANELALTALKGGCTALTFEIDDETGFDFSKVLKNVKLELIYIEYVLKNVDTLVFTEQLLNYAEGRGCDTDELNGAIYATKDVKDIDILEVRKGLLPHVRLIRIHVNHTATVSEELASILTKTKNHLKRYNNKQAIAESLVYEIGLTDHYYHNIIKVRALKLLLSNVFHAFGVKSVIPFISVRINAFKKGVDENHNIIRSNTQCMSAAIAGVDMINIHGLDHSSGPEFSKRVSRNINHIMQMESYMDRVFDPAQGSYFIESMTDQVCEKAWAIFSNR